jgi:transposase InsO family protein
LISPSVTDHPTADWIGRQLTDAFPWDEAPDYMIRDRDGRYGQAVTKRLAAMGIRDHPIAARSPWQNGHAERLIGSIRRECLDHIVVFGEAHLRRILTAYSVYYNDLRTHLSLGKDSPRHRSVQRLGKLAAQPILGGLHHQYCRT